MSALREPSRGAWGSEDTQFFYEVTPERVLTAVESAGLRCSGRCLALNSLENRVYEVEIDGHYDLHPNAPERFRVIKFYRPGRWTAEQILEEHAFLAELEALELPVVAPLPLIAAKLSDKGQAADGADRAVSVESSTLAKVPAAQVYYAVFPKVGGRTADELGDEELERMGRLLARVHNCGASRKAQHRIALNPQSYGLDNLEYLLKYSCIVPQLEARYAELVRELCQRSQALFTGIPCQRIHGDCHLGNVLWGSQGPRLVDFDDMVVGPAIQDLWLLLPGLYEDQPARWNLMLDAYRSFRDISARELLLIEPLRALRLIHFSAWIARRIKDPAFQRVFVEFGTERYWQEQLVQLQQVLSRMQRAA